MKRFSLRLCVLIAGLAVLSSCLKDDDDNVSLSSDMAITQFTLGTLNRYVKSTSSKTGNDTIIKSTVTGSTYKMSIDQINYKVYNTTELPVGTDISHVICTVTTKNSGILAIQSMTSDSLSWYSSSDSIDFSAPRIFRVYALDGSGHRDYTVSLTVSSDQGITFGWELAQTMELPTYEPLLMADGDTVTMGRESGVFGMGNTYYTIGSEDGLLKSRQQDATDWQTEILDDDASLLPAVGEYSMVDWPYAMADETDYLLLVGAPRQDDEPNMRVWRKLAPRTGGGQWVYMPFDDSNHYPLPRMNRTLLACYDGTVLCLGDDKKMLQSRDQGISWRPNSDFDLPEALTGDVVSMANDSKGRLWLLTNTGQLWRGFASK